MTGPIDLAQTLAYLERAAAEEGVLFFTAANRQAELIVQIATLIAFEARYFERCTSLIQRFVLLDRSGHVHGKMAREYLATLFALRFSGTHASVAQRVGFIRKLSTRSGDVEAELVAVLIDVMLRADSPNTYVAREFGARKRDHGFAPAATEWFAQTLSLVLEVGLSNSPGAEKVRRSFAEHLDTVVSSAPIDQVIAVAESFAVSTYWPWGWVAVRAALRRSRCRPRPPLHIREGLKRLSQSLRLTGLAATIRTYVLCNARRLGTPPRIWLRLTECICTYRLRLNMKAATRQHACNCFAIRQAARQVTRLYERHLSDAGLTSAQFSILAVLDETGGMAMIELAEALVMDRTTLLRAIKPLQREDLVKSRTGPNDPRQLIFSLTSAGERRFKQALPLWTKAQEEFESQVGSKDAARIRRELLGLAKSA